MNKAPVVCALTLLFSGSGLLADDYVGTGPLLKKIEAASATAGKKANEESRGKALLQDLKAFRKSAAALPPEEAAKQWLALASRLAELSPEELQNSNETPSPEDGNFPLSFVSLVEVLPPPASWDSLLKAVEARPEGRDAEAFRTHILRLTLYWLNNNPQAQDKEMAALRALGGKVNSKYRRAVADTLDRCQSSLPERSENGKAVLAMWQKRLERFQQQNGEGRDTFELPDLVRISGTADATAFLKAALKAPNLDLRFNRAEETQRLARKLALQMVDQLKRPQWALAQSMDGAPLYEAMDKRFPGKGQEEYDRRSATGYYLLYLLQNQKEKEAAAVAQKLGGDSSVSLPDSGLTVIERAGQLPRLAASLRGLLEKEPNLPFWSDYASVATKLGQHKELLTLAEGASQRQDLAAKPRQAILKVLAKAWLAEDNVEKGVEVMRQGVALARKAGDKAPEDALKETGDDLARLGIVLERPELVDEGIQVMRDALQRKSADRERGSSTLYDRQALGRILMEANRGPEAEAVFADTLIQLQQPPRGQALDYGDMRRTLVDLMALYHQAGRPADVLALLDSALYWGVKDLGAFCCDSVTILHNEEYAGQLAAAALASAGRKDEALKIVNALLDQQGGYDPAYELLLQLSPETAMARLDELFARDPFEERPLIWKARLLMAQGRLEEAEKCARQAISIDPTDGEQGPGRRLRAYATLGELRKARGDEKEAEFLSEVLTSVRHSDQADRLYSAGLLTRAMKIYEESLGHFAGAYCIEARLAFRKAEMGDLAGAEEHYRKAYELMPDSFGQVESYCFGCEGAFQGVRAQKIAEQVFTKLAEKSPEKPQIHYLLGYLYEEQGRDEEAVAQYRQAVKLDPNYLNAWKKLSEASGKANLSAAECDAIQVNILRLDPLGRHSDFSFERLTDLRAGWAALDEAAKARKPLPDPLYPLAASTEAVRKNEAEAAKGGRRTFYGSSSSSRDETPGKKVANKPLINYLNQFYLYSPQLYRE